MFGSAAADIRDHKDNNLNKLAKSFGVDTKRFNPVGLTLFGIRDFRVSFLCEDLQKSTDQKKHVVKLMVNEDRDNIIENLFKRLEVVLYLKHDKEFPEIDKYEELELDDYKA